MFKSLLEPFNNLLKKPNTLQYPFEKEDISHTRGLIVYEESKCIYCLKCEDVCPPCAIIFTYNIDGSKVYNYNPYLCIYCGECVRACPDSATALSQIGEVVKPATKMDRVNEAWFELQEFAKKSKEEYLEAKKQQKKESNETAS